MVFVGVDWAEEHHDICVLNNSGEVLAERRIDDSLAGLTKLEELLASHSDDPSAVVIGIETDHGLLVRSLLASGYSVYAINPRSVDRYRDRHVVSGAKSDARDARVLADVVRTDRHHHRPIEGDSELAQSIQVLARTHRSLVWTRQRQANQLRNVLREFYPAALDVFGTDLTAAPALAVLALAPTPERGRTLSRAQLASALRRGGRQRNVETKAAEIKAALRGAPTASLEPDRPSVWDHRQRDRAHPHRAQRAAAPA